MNKLDKYLPQNFCNCDILLPAHSMTTKQYEAGESNEINLFYLIGSSLIVSIEDLTY